MEIYCKDCESNEFDILIDETLFYAPSDPENVKAAEFTTCLKCRKCGKQYPVHRKKI